MPDLLLELFSEEIPARMQRRAAEDLRKLVTDALVERGFLYDGAKAFATPRRLALTVAGLPARGQDVREERKGPRVGAPEAAVQGFLKSAGLASLDEARVVADPRKGEFYVAVIERPGRETGAVLAEILPAIVRAFPWPKSMRWGAGSAAPGGLRWVRPLHSIVCTFGPETETPEVVPFAVDGIASGTTTRGHRFLAPAPFEVRRFADYAPALERAKVVLDADRRRDIILHDARDLAFARGLELVEDEALLEEVAGLVEWPVVLMGTFDEAFLEIPAEAIRATIRANQKCFVLRPTLPASGKGDPAEARSGDATQTAERLHPAGLDGTTSPRGGEVESAGGAPGEGAPTSPRAAQPPHPTLSPSGRGVPSSNATGLPQDGRDRLANAFILVSNLEASDGGAAIVAGNERVVRARLSDARFFFEQDRRVPLQDRLEKLTSIVFHEKLGTQHERVERIAALAKELAPAVGADPALAERAARLAKADLVTEMVGEFPELQGLMGRRYAELQGEHPSVCAAIEEHYKPQGPSDRVPRDPVSVAVALADKLDTLVGFWAIDEKPTGSKDPYALRRAALGVVRLVLERDLSFDLIGTIVSAYLSFLLGLQQRKTYVYLRTLSGFDHVTITRLRYVDEFSDAKFDLSEKIVLVRSDKDEDTRFSIAGAVSLDQREVIGGLPAPQSLAAELAVFFHDRLKVYLRDQGARHDLIDAVLAPNASPLAGEVGRPKAGSEGGRAGGTAGASSGTTPTPDPSPQGGGEGASTGTGTRSRSSRPAPHPEVPASAGLEGGLQPAARSLEPSFEASAGAPAPQDEVAGRPQDDLLMIVRRVEALGRFLDTEDGRNLLAGYRRAANILRIEEKKDSRAYDAPPAPALLREPAERALADALATARQAASAAVAAEDFEGAMRALSGLRHPVDAFFEAVTVNDPDPALRANRLALLNALRAATREVADFSRIEG